MKIPAIRHFAPSVKTIKNTLKTAAVTLPIIAMTGSCSSVNNASFETKHSKRILHNPDPMPTIPSSSANVDSTYVYTRLLENA